MSILLIAAAPAIAEAQDDAERARLLFEQGVAAMDAGDAATAARYFDESYVAFPRASTACNMAVAQERLSQPCDAQRWYQQCAALDRTGRFADHATRQASALGAQCQAAPPPQPQTYVPPSNSQVQIVEGSQLRPVPVIHQRVDTAPASPDHTLLGVGIGALVLGGGALVGGIVSAEAAWGEYRQISVPSGPIAEGTTDAQHYDQAALFSDVAIALYVGAGVLGALGLILVAIDLAQPGVFGGSASVSPDGVTVRF